MSDKVPAPGGRVLVYNDLEMFGECLGKFILVASRREVPAFYVAIEPCGPDPLQGGIHFAVVRITQGCDLDLLAVALDCPCGHDRNLVALFTKMASKCVKGAIEIGEL